MRKILLLLLAALGLARPGKTQPPLVSYQPYITGLSAPIDIVHAGDGSNRLFLVQQGGLIRVWNGTTLSNFMNLGSGGANIISTGGEQGLLSMAFHPDYNGTTNRYFFVYFTNTASDLELRRYETTVGNPDLGDPATGVTVLTIAHPGQTNHNGGKLLFGTDGHLYFATGDGGGGNDPSNNAQNGMSLLGKMIRINVDNFTTPPYYTVPATNPFVGNASYDARIFDLGLRNPFRWSFDRLSGNMWIGDVGQGMREEVNFRAPADQGGNNFGWRCFEGYISTPGVPDCTPPNNVFPVYDYDNPSSGAAAVTGGFVYRGPDYPAFRGYYISADVYSGNIYLLWSNGSGGFDSAVQSGLQNFIVTFGEAEDGTLYAASQGTGVVYKVVATGGTPLPVSLLDFRVQRPQSNGAELVWTTGFEQALRGFAVEWSRDGRAFTEIAWVAASGGANGRTYTWLHTALPAGTNVYRLRMEDQDGTRRYSALLRLNGGGGKPSVYPTLVRDGRIQVMLQSEAEAFRLIDGRGTVVFEKRHLPAGTQSLTLPALSPGIYVAEIRDREGRHATRVMVER